MGLTAHLLTNLPSWEMAFCTKQKNTDKEKRVGCLATFSMKCFRIISPNILFM